ncbi:50S ribosomal protein L11 [Blattabacterium cuenoti]|uniref:50S ribosomal protein L11 n=1 Tax=Blattabacterium cuenoti TaxID=1653831 RepID=UPI00163B9E96|nr:50S ribosomal protein L11 [Blattabacterium cuenoti]
MIYHESLTLIKTIKIQKIYGGQANPAPPIGPMLGSSGVNIMEFCKQYNHKTKGLKGLLCPVIINIYKNKSFSFIIKQPPVSIQLLNLINKKKGSKESNREKIGTINMNQIKTIANNKIKDMNCYSIKSAMSMIIGTAKSLGIDII